MNLKSARKRKNPDLRTPQEKAEWEEIRAGSVEMQRRARMPEAPKPFDLWSYDTAHLLDELAGIREMILRVPITLQTKSALQSATDLPPGSVALYTWCPPSAYQPMPPC